MQPIHLLSSFMFLAGLVSLDATRSESPDPEKSLIAGTRNAPTFIGPDESASSQDGAESWWARIKIDGPYDPDTAPPEATFHYGDGDKASTNFTAGHQTSGKFKSYYYDYESFPTYRWFHVTEGAGKSWFQRDPWF